MSDQSFPTPENATLSDVIAAYLEAVDAGHKPDGQGLLVRYPRLADELRQFFATQECLEHLGQPLREVSQSATRELVNPAYQGRSETLPVGEIIRYLGDYELGGEIAR